MTKPLVISLVQHLPKKCVWKK